MKVEQIHHVAYRCKNAKETVQFYQDVLGMEFLMAMAEDRAPSTKALDPYMHVFLDAGAGNIIAFFELPNSPPMGRDPNTPDWVQHIAFRVKDEATMLEAKAKAEARGCSVVDRHQPGDFTPIANDRSLPPPMRACSSSTSPRHWATRRSVVGERERCRRARTHRSRPRGRSSQV